MPAHDKNDTTPIWLRQSARFTVGDQRRTIEIAIPVQPGASAAEIEQLLREADAGMSQVTAHLNAQVARIAGASPTTSVADSDAPGEIASNTTTTTTTPAPAPTSPAKPTSEARHPTPPPATATAPATDTDADADRAGTARPETRVRESAEPTSHPAPSRPAAVLATPASPAARPTAPAPPAATHAPAAPSTQRATAASATHADSPAPTLPEFLAETRTLGLNPMQVMERLGVRSLAGLDLREALNTLRRDVALGQSDAGSNEHSATTRAAASATAHTTTAAPASAPRAGGASGANSAAAATRFDEEDNDADYDVTFSLGDDAEGDDLAAYGAAEDDESFDEADESAPLDDVPDFDTPTPAARTASAATTRRAAATAARTTGGDDEAEMPATADARRPISVPLRARAAELIEQLRATTPGGEPLPNQLTAYAHLLIGQLDAARAAALVKGLWHTTHEQLGTEQLQALIRWSKEDAFDDEAPAVLAALAAEQAARANANTNANGGATASGTARATSARATSARATSTRATNARAARPSGSSGAAQRQQRRGGGSR